MITGASLGCGDGSFESAEGGVGNCLDTGTKTTGIGPGWEKQFPRASLDTMIDGPVLD